MHCSLLFGLFEIFKYLKIKDIKNVVFKTSCKIHFHFTIVRSLILYFLLFSINFSASKNPTAAFNCLYVNECIYLTQGFDLFGKPKRLERDFPIELTLTVIHIGGF